MHTKKLRCGYPNCRKTYTSRFTLRRHLEAFHYRIKRLTCPHCEKSFAYKHSLKDHLQKHAEMEVVEPGRQEVAFPTLIEMLKAAERWDWVRPDSSPFRHQ